jgi:hypothetical protein
MVVEANAGEDKRRSGASPKLVFVLVLAAGFALALAVMEYQYARDFAALGRHPPVVHTSRSMVVMRDIFIGRVAESIEPRAGVWGCVAVFALPGSVCLFAAAWILIRGSRRSRPAS